MFAPPRPEGLWVGKCQACGAAQSAHEPARSLPCPACGAPIEMEQVKGHYSSENPCDRSCQYAIGVKCECQCGGAEHGAGFIAWEFVPEKIKSKLRRSHEQIVARREAKIAAKAAKIAAVIEAHPALAIEPGSSENYFINDVIRKLHENAALSPAQISAVERAIVGEAARKVREAEWAAKAAAEVKVEVPEGRREIVGEVLTVKFQENDFGGSLKMLIAVAEGYKLWGSVPGNISEVKRGEHVKFVATVAAKEVGFGFFSRPAKAEVLVAA